MIPRIVIAEVASVLSAHYFSHSRIENLFTRCGAPGNAPPGNLIDRMSAWLEGANEDPSVDAYSVLGCVLMDFMETETADAEWLAAREGTKRVLARHGLTYQQGGQILGGATQVANRSLQTIIRDRDLDALRVEFDRALATVETDPPSAVTAACAIVESLCKVYLQTEGLDMPSDQSIKPLWRAVQAHLGLSPQRVVNDDLRKILGGLSSIVDGVGSIRTHAGSAHGRGHSDVALDPRHARLAVHAAHTLVHFVLETWNPQG